MFTDDEALILAHKIADDWNSKELNDFLDYFTDDVEIVSTNISRFIIESNGKLNGKNTLKNYWEFMRVKFPYFKYKLHQVNHEGNNLILKFHNSIDDTYSIGTLFFNDERKIYKMKTSYV